MNITLNKKKIDSVTVTFTVEEYVLVQSVLGKIASKEAGPSRTIFHIYDEMCKKTGSPYILATPVARMTFSEENLQKEVERISNYEG